MDVAAWRLNRELTYLVPAGLASKVHLGSIVRVSLKGRRVRGWVVGIQEGAVPDQIVSVAAVSGRGPVFDEALLSMARSLARRYVHPLSCFLSLFTPARLGRPASSWPQVPSPGRGGRGGRTLLRLGPGTDPVQVYAEVISTELAMGKGAIVAVPEVREGSRVLQGLADAFVGEAALVHSGLDPMQRSAALWEVAAGRRRVVLGGRSAMFAPPLALGTIVVHQEHDPSFKEQRSPYYDAREAALHRARVSGSGVLFASSTPSLRGEYWAGEGWRMVHPARSAERAGWPAVEVVSPARRGLPERAIGAIIRARSRGERVIILLPRILSTPAGPGSEELVRLLTRVVPGARVTRADRPNLGPTPGVLQEALEGDVILATEAALADVPRAEVGLAIALGVDGYFRRPRGRAAEEAVATLWSLANLVAGNRTRGRLIIEAHNLEHHAIQAVLRADYRYFVQRELADRRAFDAPPFVSMVRLQTTQDRSAELARMLHELPSTKVLGPVPGGSLGSEILLKVADLESILDMLANIVAAFPRRVLVEVDPKDW